MAQIVLIIPQSTLTEKNNFYTVKVNGLIFRFEWRVKCFAKQVDILFDDNKTVNKLSS